MLELYTDKDEVCELKLIGRSIVAVSQELNQPSMQSSISSRHKLFRFHSALSPEFGLAIESVSVGLRLDWVVAQLCEIL